MPAAAWTENFPHAKARRCKSKDARCALTAPLHWAVGSYLRRDRSRQSSVLQDSPDRAWAQSISPEWNCEEGEKEFRYKSARVYPPSLRRPTQAAAPSPVRRGQRDRKSYRPGGSRKDRWGHRSQWPRIAPRHPPLFWRALRSERDRRSWAAAPARSSTKALRERKNW